MMKIPSKLIFTRLRAGSLGEVSHLWPSTGLNDSSNNLGETEPNNFLDEFETVTDLTTALEDISMASINLPEADIDTNLEPEALDTLPNLFLEFSDLKISDGSKNFHEFVSKYGFLGKGKIQETTGEVDQNRSEPVEFWILMQYEINSVIRLWRGIRSAGKKYNLQLLQASGMLLRSFKGNELPFSVANFLDSIHYLSKIPNALKFLPRPSVHPYGKPLSEFTDREVIDFCTAEMEMRLNRLLALASPSLKMEAFDRAGVPHVLHRGLGSAKPKSHKSEVIFLHETLLSAIVWQLSCAISEDLKFRKCLECFSWIQGSEKGTTGNRYCSGACRNKAYKRRKELENLIIDNPHSVEMLQTFFHDFTDAYTDISKELFDSDFEQLLNDLAEHSQRKVSNERYKILVETCINYGRHLRQLVEPETIADHFGFTKDTDAGLEMRPVISHSYKMNLAKIKLTDKTAYFDWSLPKINLIDQDYALEIARHEIDRWVPAKKKTHSKLKEAGEAAAKKSLENLERIWERIENKKS